MFNATYFQYDGQWSGTYGLQIVDFNDDNVRETDAFSPNLTLMKAPGALRFYFGGIEYDSPPTCEFSVVSEQELTGDMRSVILSWLIGRKGFKPLTFEDGDNDEYTYYGIFTSAKTIWVNGHCHGFRLTAQLDSPFARGESTELKITGGSDHEEVVIRNKSNIADGYTYPTVKFVGNTTIVNSTDDPGRAFQFENLRSDAITTVDNELKLISSTAGGEILSKFTSKNWLRLRPGYNTLIITSDGDVTITCPHYAMIGY